MSQGRGNAVIAAMLLCVLVVHIEVAQSATHTVGDEKGWTFNVAGWPEGRRFNAGDTLVFNYNSRFHNVVAVDKAGYESCTTPHGAKVYQTGKDEIDLAKGHNFFICNFPGHCESSMKIAITAV